MAVSEEMIRFAKDLNEKEDLKEKLDEVTRKLLEDKKAESDGELMVKAAEELGYHFTIADLEQSKAEAEALDPEDLAAVSGGYRQTCEGSTWVREDEYGHDENCIVGWHCNMAFMHTKSKEPYVRCWSDHRCNVVNKEVYEPVE